MLIGIEEIATKCLNLKRQIHVGERQSAGIHDVFSYEKGKVYKDTDLCVISADNYLDICKNMIIPKNMLIVNQAKRPTLTDNLKDRNFMWLEMQCEVEKISRKVEEFVQLAILKKLNEGYEQLLRSLAIDAGEFALLKIASSIMGCPVGLMNFSYKLDFVGPKEQEESLYLHIQKQIDSGQKKGFQRGYTYLIQDRKYDFLDFAVPIRNKIEAIVSFMGNKNRFFEEDYRFVEMFVQVLIHELGKNDFLVQNPSVASKKLLYDMITGVPYEGSQIEFAFNRDLDIYNKNKKIVVLERKDSRRKENDWQHIVLEDYFPNYICIQHGKELVVFCWSDKEFLEFEQQFYNIELLAKRSESKIAISNTFKDFAMAQRYYTQCKYALSAAMHKETDVVYGYQIALQHAFSVGAMNQSFLDCCHPLIRKMNFSENENDIELLKTLYLWIKCDYDIVSICDILHVQKSTIYYRINKMKELLHSDLDDTETVFQIMFSFYLIEYYSQFLIGTEKYWFTELRYQMEDHASI